MSDKDIVINDIDAGNGFNWGKTSKDYAKYRDIYPEEFYQYIINLGLCKDGQKCLDNWNWDRSSSKKYVQIWC